MESLLDILIDKVTSERLYHKLYKDEEYLELHKELDKTIERFDSLELNLEQNLIVDKMISAYNAENAFYSEKAYQQGIYDCVQFLKEINVL